MAEPLPDDRGPGKTPRDAAAAQASGPTKARLLGDIGGTHARFGWQATEAAEPTDVITLPSADHASLAEAMKAYLAQIGRPPPPWCAIGIANPVTGDQVRMTNHDWSFSISALQRELGFERFVVVNDFTALALALPALGARDVRQFGGGAPVADAAIGLIGPGTGLGVSGLLPGGQPGQWVAIQGEGGHVTLAAATDREARVLASLRDEFGHASAERAVSGQGLESLFAALCRLAGRPVDTALSAAEISGRAIDASDPQCVEALDLFCGFLGSTAGNLALTLGARGGVYIGGGIVPRLGDAFFRSRFRTCFEAKGRFREYLSSIPVFVIEANVSPALLGASRAL